MADVCGECVHKDPLMWPPVRRHLRGGGVSAVPASVSSGGPGAAEAGCRRHVHDLLHRGPVSRSCHTGM